MWCYKPFAPLGHGLYGGVFFVIGVQIQAIGIESCKAQACTVAQVCDASKDAMISTAWKKKRNKKFFTDKS